jgi:hypothetical protein
VLGAAIPKNSTDLIFLAESAIAAPGNMEGANNAKPRTGAKSFAVLILFKIPTTLLY